MTDIFQKLNLLIRSGLRELVGDPPNLESLRRLLASGGLGPDLDAEVDSLRQKVNDAIAYEDILVGRVREFQAQAEALNGQADDAVASGDDDKARELIAQMKRIEQRAAMAEADLREHRFITQDLIQRVNMLEAVVAQAKADRQAKSEPDQPAKSGGLTEILRSVREQLDHDVETPPTSSTTAAPDTGPTRKGIEDDFERRRQRLTKPNGNTTDKP